MITHSKDSTVTYIENKYPDLFLLRLNIDQIASYQINISDRGCTITTNQWNTNLEDAHAVYYRKIAYPDLSTYDKGLRPLMAKELLALTEGLVETFGKRCLTRPSILKRAENKIVQLQIAKKIGFRLPLSSITNNDRSAQAFVTSQTSIVKPLATGKLSTLGQEYILQTNLVPPSELPVNLSHCPSYFQAYIPKDYELRVTIVDKQVFAVKIEAGNDVDWRKSYSSNIYEVIDLPESITSQCFEFMKALKINFGAFDFIVLNGEYYFLEVNPNGQWLWLEEALNIKISNAIVHYLEGGDCE